MNSFLKKILILIIHFLFEDNEFNRLEKDLERRFRKPSMNRQSVLWKVKYLNRNTQYKTLIYYRLFCAARNSVIRKIFYSLYQKSSIKTGVEFLSPIIGGGVIMPHWGRIILNARQIGDDLYVFHNVTIGNDYATGKPKIGNNVFIGTNSVILGNIVIGDNVIVGACSYVNTDIPSNSIAVGNPAKIIKTIDDEYITKILGY